MTTAVNRWARLDDFLPTSSQQVKEYCERKRYKIPKDRKTKKATTGKEALETLIRRHRDPVLELVVESRHLRKAAGYLDDARLGRDGRFHPTYTFSPDTGRLASINPNFQNQPKHGVDEELAAAIRETIVPSPGFVLVELDWRNVEAVLTGWFADDQDYIWLSQQDSHAYFASYLLHYWGKRKEPLRLDMDKQFLLSELKAIKRNHEAERYLAKRVNLATGYGMGPKHLSELVRCSWSEAVAFLKLKEEMAPKVSAWHTTVRRLAHRQGYLETPFLYRRAFFDVFRKDPKTGEIILGDEANKALAFLPQGTAAAMLRETIIDVHELQLSGRVGEFHALVPIHDALLLEVRQDCSAAVSAAVKALMEKQWPELGGLSIAVEVKQGLNWSQMT